MAEKQSFDVQRDNEFKKQKLLFVAERLPPGPLAEQFKKILSGAPMPHEINVCMISMLDYVKKNKLLTALLKAETPNQFIEKACEYLSKKSLQMEFKLFLQGIKSQLKDIHSGKSNYQDLVDNLRENFLNKKDIPPVIRALVSCMSAIADMEVKRAQNAKPGGEYAALPFGRDSAANEYSNPPAAKNSGYDRVPNEYDVPPEIVPNEYDHVPPEIVEGYGVLPDESEYRYGKIPGAGAIFEVLDKIKEQFPLDETNQQKIEAFREFVIHNGDPDHQIYIELRNIMSATTKNIGGHEYDLLPEAKLDMLLDAMKNGMERMDIETPTNTGRHGLGG